jgi:hypothetical protein
MKPMVGSRRLNNLQEYLVNKKPAKSLLIIGQARTQKFPEGGAQSFFTAMRVVAFRSNFEDLLSRVNDV